MRILSIGVSIVLLCTVVARAIPIADVGLCLSFTTFPPSGTEVSASFTVTFGFDSKNVLIATNSSMASFAVPDLMPFILQTGRPPSIFLVSARDTSVLVLPASVKGSLVSTGFGTSHLNVTFASLPAFSAFYLRVESVFYSSTTESMNAVSSYHYYYTAGGDDTILRPRTPSVPMLSSSCFDWSSLIKPPVMPLRPNASSIGMFPNVTQRVVQCQNASCRWYLEYNITFFPASSPKFSAVISLPADVDGYQYEGRQLSLNFSFNERRNVSIPITLQSYFADAFEAVHSPLTAIEPYALYKKVRVTSAFVQERISEAVINDWPYFVLWQNTVKRWSRAVEAEFGGVYSTDIYNVESTVLARRRQEVTLVITDGTLSNTSYVFSSVTKKWLLTPLAFVDCPKGSVRNILCPLCDVLRYSLGIRQATDNIEVYDIIPDMSLISDDLSVSLVTDSLVLDNVRWTHDDIVISSGEFFETNFNPFSMTWMSLSDYRLMVPSATSANASSYKLLPKSLFSENCGGINMPFSVFLRQQDFCSRSFRECSPNWLKNISGEPSFEFFRQVPYGCDIPGLSSHSDVRVNHATTTLDVNYGLPSTATTVSLKIFNNAFFLSQPVISPSKASDWSLILNKTAGFERSATLRFGIMNSGSVSGVFVVNFTCSRGIIPSEASISILALPQRSYNLSTRLIGVPGTHGTQTCALSGYTSSRPLWDSSLLTFGGDEFVLRFPLDNGYFIPEMEAYFPGAPSSSFVSLAATVAGIRNQYNVYQNLGSHQYSVSPPTGFLIAATSLDVTLTFSTSDVYLIFDNRRETLTSTRWAPLSAYASERALLQDLWPFGSYAAAISLRSVNGSTETEVLPTSIVTFPVVGSALTVRFTGLKAASFFYLLITDRFIASKQYAARTIWEVFPSSSSIHYLTAGGRLQFPIYDALEQEVLFSIPDNGTLPQAETSLSPLLQQRLSSIVSCDVPVELGEACTNFSIVVDFVSSSLNASGTSFTVTNLQDSFGNGYHIAPIRLRFSKASDTVVNASVTFLQTLMGVYEHVEMSSLFPSQDYPFMSERYWLEISVSHAQRLMSLFKTGNFTLFSLTRQSSPRVFSRGTVYTGTTDAQSILDATTQYSGFEALDLRSNQTTRLAVYKDPARRSLGPKRWYLLPSNSEAIGVTCARGSRRNRLCPRCGPMRHVMMASQMIPTYDVFRISGTPSVRTTEKVIIDIANVSCVLQSDSITGALCGGARLNNFNSTFGLSSLGVLQSLLVLLPSADASNTVVSTFQQIRFVPQSLFGNDCGQTSTSYTAFYSRTDFCEQEIGTCLESNVAALVRNRSHFISALPYHDALVGSTAGSERVRISGSNLMLHYDAGKLPTVMSFSIPSKLVDFLQPNISSVSVALVPDDRPSYMRFAVLSLHITNGGRLEGRGTVVVTCSSAVQILSSQPVEIRLLLGTTTFNLSLAGHPDASGLHHCNVSVVLQKLPFWSSSGMSATALREFSLSHGSFTPFEYVDINTPRDVVAAASLLHIGSCIRQSAIAIRPSSNSLHLTVSFSHVVSSVLVDGRLRVLCRTALNISYFCAISSFLNDDDLLTVVRKYKAVYLWDDSLDTAILPVSVTSVNASAIECRFSAVSMSNNHRVIVSERWGFSSGDTVFATDLMVSSNLQYTVGLATSVDGDYKQSVCPLASPSVTTSPIDFPADDLPLPLHAENTVAVTGCTSSDSRICGTVIDDWYVTVRYHSPYSSTLAISDFADNRTGHSYELEHPLHVTVNNGRQGLVAIPLEFVSYVPILVEDVCVFCGDAGTKEEQLFFVSEAYAESVLRHSILDSNRQVYFRNASEFVRLSAADDALVEASYARQTVYKSGVVSFSIRDSLGSSALFSLEYKVPRLGAKNFAWHLTVMREYTSCACESLLGRCPRSVDLWNVRNVTRSVWSDGGSRLGHFRLNPSQSLVDLNMSVVVESASLASVSLLPTEKIEMVHRATRSLSSFSSSDQLVKVDAGNAGIDLSDFSAMDLMMDANTFSMSTMRFVPQDLLAGTFSAPVSSEGAFLQTDCTVGKFAQEIYLNDSFSVTSLRALDGRIQIPDVYSDGRSLHLKYRRPVSRSNGLSMTVAVAGRGLRLKEPLISDVIVSSVFSFDVGRPRRYGFINVSASNSGSAPADVRLNVSCSDGCRILSSGYTIDPKTSRTIAFQVDGFVGYYGLISCTVTSVYAVQRPLWKTVGKSMHVGLTLYQNLSDGYFVANGEPSNRGSAVVSVLRKFPPRLWDCMNVSMHVASQVVSMTVVFHKDTTIGLSLNGTAGHPEVHSVVDYYDARDLLHDITTPSSVAFLVRRVPLRLICRVGMQDVYYVPSLFTASNASSFVVEFRTNHSSEQVSEYRLSISDSLVDMTHSLRVPALDIRVSEFSGRTTVCEFGGLADLRKVCTTLDPDVGVRYVDDVSLSVTGVTPQNATALTISLQDVPSVRNHSFFNFSTLPYAGQNYSFDPVTIRSRTSSFPTLLLKLTLVRRLQQFFEWKEPGNVTSLLSALPDSSNMFESTVQEVQKLFNSLDLNDPMVILHVLDHHLEQFVPWSIALAASNVRYSLNAAVLEANMIDLVSYVSRITNRTSGHHTYIYNIYGYEERRGYRWYIRSTLETVTCPNNAVPFVDHNEPNEMVSTSMLAVDHSTSCGIFSLSPDNIMVDTGMDVVVTSAGFSSTLGVSEDVARVKYSPSRTSGYSANGAFTFNVTADLTDPMFSLWDLNYLMICDSIAGNHSTMHNRHLWRMVPKSLMEPGCGTLRPSFKSPIPDLCARAHGQCADGILLQILRNSSTSFDRALKLERSPVGVLLDIDQWTVAVTRAPLVRMNLTLSLPKDSLVLTEPRLAPVIVTDWRLIVYSSASEVDAIGDVRHKTASSVSSFELGCLRPTQPNMARLCIPLRNDGPVDGEYDVTLNCGLLTGTRPVRVRTKLTALSTSWLSFLLQSETAMFLEQVCSFSVEISDPLPFWSEAIKVPKVLPAAFPIVVTDGIFADTCQNGLAQPSLLYTVAEWEIRGTPSRLVDPHDVSLTQSDWNYVGSDYRKGFSFRVKNVGNATAETVNNIVCTGDADSKAFTLNASDSCTLLAGQSCTVFGVVTVSEYRGPNPNLSCWFAAAVKSHRCWSLIGKAFATLAIIPLPTPGTAHYGSAAVGSKPACNTEFWCTEFGTWLTDTFTKAGTIAIFFVLLIVCILVLAVMIWWLARVRRRRCEQDPNMVDGMFSTPTAERVPFVCACGRSAKYVCSGCESPKRYFCHNEACWNWFHSGVIDDKSHEPTYLSEMSDRGLENSESDCVDSSVDQRLLLSSDLAISDQRADRRMSVIPVEGGTDKVANDHSHLLDIELEVDQ